MTILDLALREERTPKTVGELLDFIAKQKNLSNHTPLEMLVEGKSFDVHKISLEHELSLEGPVLTLILSTSND